MKIGEHVARRHFWIPLSSELVEAFPPPDANLSFFHRIVEPVSWVGQAGLPRPTATPGRLPFTPRRL